jgi:hypothetical protein
VWVCQSVFPAVGTCGILGGFFVTPSPAPLNGPFHPSKVLLAQVAAAAKAPCRKNFRLETVIRYLCLIREILKTSNSRIIPSYGIDTAISFESFLKGTPEPKEQK